MNKFYIAKLIITLLFYNAFFQYHLWKKLAEKNNIYQSVLTDFKKTIEEMIQEIWQE